MKKICFVDFDMSVTGGAEKVTVSLANTLCEKYKVYLYEINRGAKLAYELDDRVIYVPGMTGKTRLREMIEGAFRPFIRFVKQHQIDVVILMGNYPALIVSFTRFFTKARYIYCDHGALMNQWKQKDITAIRFWDSLVAHKTVVLTEKTKKDYIKKFHMKPKKVQCIYNWIEYELLEQREPYNGDSHLILSVGRFGKEKGYDMLVRVAEKVLPENQDWQWHVYGFGETFEEISHLVKKCGLEKQLILKGNVANVHCLYPEYAFLVLPSYREGLPLVLLEASALGLPMVSFDIETGPNEIIVQGENGYLVPPYSIEKMAARILELMKDRDKREYMSQHTKKTLDKFDKENILKQWIDLIEE